MAHIDVERKKKSGWPWIILALIILGLIVWALYAWVWSNDVDVAVPATAVTAPVETPPLPVANEPSPEQEAIAAPVMVAPMPPPPTAADDTPIPVATIIVGPASFLGQPVTGTGHVAAVVSDRGFWLEQDGKRMFVMVAKSPSMEATVNVNPGERVRLAGVIYNESMISQIVGGIEPDARAFLADQPAFLLVNATNVVAIPD